MNSKAEANEGKQWTDTQIKLLQKSMNVYNVTDIPKIARFLQHTENEVLVMWRKLQKKNPGEDRIVEFWSTEETVRLL